jgi:hypothetical protein
MALAVWLPAAPTRSTTSPVRTQRTRTGTRNARTPTLDTPDNGHPDTPGHRTPDAWTSHAWTPDIGHRTSDTGRLDAERGCGQGDQGTTGIRTSRPHDEPTACWTPNRVPVGPAHAALGHHDGSAVRRPASARDTAYRTTRQLLGRSARGQAAPRRTAVLRRFRVERRARRWGSSVMASPYLGGCCGGKCGSVCASSVGVD